MVKVQLTSGAVESFDAPEDAFDEREDGKLEVYRADGTVKVYTENSWLTVDGVKREHPRAAFL